MRKTLLFLMLLSVKLTFGQISDGFDDGDFIRNPQWSGHTNRFMVNSSKQLQTSLSAMNQTVNLVTPNMLATNTSWEFFVQLNFDPSSTNQARIYLVADVASLDGPVNGYFIQIGESGSADSFDLYRQTGLVATKIIDGPSKPRANPNILSAKVRITRTEKGYWELLTDVDGGNNYQLEGNATDLDHSYTDWFGISCKHTSTRSDGFIFDHISVRELSPDLTPPSLISAKAVDEHTIEVVFSERLDLSSALHTSNYRLSNFGAPDQTVATNLPHTFKLSYSVILPSGSYKLAVNGIKDLQGNINSPGNEVSFLYVRPYAIQKGDLLLSEVLVNPSNGGVDFIEIYNNSEQILDLKDVQLANVDENGDPANLKKVSANSLYLFPKSYGVLTTNPAKIKEHYRVKFPEHLFLMSSMPSYNNDKGTVILLSNMLLDRFDYNENMHFGLLQNDDGVSLERASFIKDANEQGNFRSAAKSSGFATPTYQNSQTEIGKARNAINISNRVFSPDGDGFEDFLVINFRFVSGSYMASVNVFTDKGILIRRLEKNATIAGEGSFQWDGLDDAGQQCKVGIYLLKFDAFNFDGKTTHFQQACVLAAKLR